MSLPGPFVIIGLPRRGLPRSQSLRTLFAASVACLPTSPLHVGIANGQTMAIKMQADNGRD
jgi:hypothetical protein